MFLVYIGSKNYLKFYGLQISLIISAILGLTSIHGLGYIDSVVITDREYMHFGGSEIHFWLAQSYNIIQLN